MSHFVIAVFHGENQSVNELLAPYDESIENNPNTKWDWYKIGGAWDSYLKLKNGKFTNSAKLKDIDFSNFSTYAVVTANGQWHEPGPMGWFGISLATSEQEQTWYKDFYKKFLENENPELFITIVDCHI